MARCHGSSSSPTRGSPRSTWSGRTRCSRPPAPTTSRSPRRDRAECDRSRAVRRPGPTILADRSLRSLRGPIDTLIVVRRRTARWPPRATTRSCARSRRAAARSRRVASVCTGAFLLAAAGVLDGRRATTHWQACELLARRHPAITVDKDPIFVRDGDVWTSAGVTAGMDLALALVTEDLGREPRCAWRAPARDVRAAAGRPGAVQRAARRSRPPSATRSCELQALDRRASGRRLERRAARRHASP